MDPAAKHFGHDAESRAAAILEAEGLEILGRNVRAGHDEIDLIARDGQVLVLVEVKARKGGLIAADLAFTRAKRARMLRAWQRLRQDGRVGYARALRCDLVLFAASGAWTHLRDL
jgi:putative endonuclease